MKAFLAQGLVLLAVLSLADGLTCNVCEFKPPVLGCLQGKGTADCKSGETCLTTKAYFGNVKIFSKFGCTTADADKCNSTEKTDQTFSLRYQNICCNSTDLCNAGSVTRLSAFAGLAVLGLCMMKLL